MGTVTGFDPSAEHEKTRAALGAVVPRLVRLLRDVPDLDAASGVPVWTVSDVGSHLSAVYIGYSSASSADESMAFDAGPWDGKLSCGFLPSAGHPIVCAWTDSGTSGRVVLADEQSLPGAAEIARRFRTASEKRT